MRLYDLKGFLLKKLAIMGDILLSLSLWLLSSNDQTKTTFIAEIVNRIRTFRKNANGGNYSKRCKVWPRPLDNLITTYQICFTFCRFWLWLHQQPKCCIWEISWASVSCLCWIQPASEETTADDLKEKHIIIILNTIQGDAATSQSLSPMGGPMPTELPLYDPSYSAIARLGLL